MIDKSEFQIKIGSHIKNKREAKGYSAAEFSRMIEMDRPNLHKLERGGYSPSLYLLSKIADVLGLSIQEFLDGFEY
jgi:transcriptional regulator with XRE-family HTH domain